MPFIYLIRKEIIMNEYKSISKYLGTNLKQTYHSTKNKFVHIKGKISKIIGSSEIEIDYYDSKVGINGYVNFEDNKKIVLKEQQNILKGKYQGKLTINKVVMYYINTLYKYPLEDKHNKIIVEYYNNYLKTKD